MKVIKLQLKGPDGKPYRPTRTQKILHNNLRRFRLLSGSFGGGKTVGGCMEGLILSLEHPGNRGIVGRLTYPEWRETTWRVMLDILEANGLLNEKNYIKSERKVILPNGSEIYGTSFDKAEKLGSHELGWYFLDEAREFPYEIHRMMRGRLRLKTVPFHAGIYSTNPDSETHWLYQDFVAKPTIHHLFIQGNLEDNRMNLPADYVADLLSLKDTDPEFFKRFVDGIWGAFEGLIYKMWNTQVHVKEAKDLPKIQETFFGMDFGFSTPAAIEIIGIDEHWNTYVVDEYYQTEGTPKDWIAALKVFDAKWHMRRGWADPSSPEHIKAIADAGFNIEKAVAKDKKYGIQIVRQRLAYKEGMPPKHYVCSHCFGNVKEKSAFRFDPKNPDTILKKDDHAQDAERYCLVGIQELSKQSDHSASGVASAPRSAYAPRRRSLMGGRDF